MRIFRRVPTLRFDLIRRGGLLMAIEIPTTFEVTHVLGIMLIAGLGCLMEVVGGAEGGILGTAMVVVNALELSSVGRRVMSRLFCVTLCLCMIEFLPVFAFPFEGFVLLAAIAHGGARREGRTFVFKMAGSQSRLA